ncbi:hypothetical protein ACH347_34290 [Saccharopolyspora sp. 5N102]|uniref:hypothetical protein n=1 Tax=Saccharopolyspora sp. 5N102 TaxID=3375155 RepID=UPI003787B388
MTKAHGNLGTYELWLEDVIETLHPCFIEVGLPLPERVRASVGFGYAAKCESAKIPYQCRKREAPEDGANHIFISPEIADTAEALAILLHELIHAAANIESGHRGKFAEAATRLGLKRPMTATTASASLMGESIALAAALGDYPHDALYPARVAVPARSPRAGSCLRFIRVRLRGTGRRSR